MANTAVSTLRVGGQNVATPGAVSQVKQVSEQAPSLASNGVLAIIGPARNGAPLTVLNFDKLEGVQNYLKLTDLNGDIGLRVASEWACDASSDDAVQGQPSRLVLIKTNRDTPASATIYGSVAALFTVNSLDYGAHVNKISLAIAAGTLKGVKLTIKDGLGGTPEIGDNLGGDAALTLKYAGQADAAVVTIDSTGLKVLWQKSFAGLNGAASEVKNGWASGVIFCKSDDVGDTYQRVTVYGLDAGNNPISATFLLTGTTEVAPSTTFAKLTGARIDGAHKGVIKVSSGTGGAFAAGVFITFTANADDVLTSDGKVKVQSDSAADAGKQVELVGYDTTGNIAQGLGLKSEIITLGAVNTPVESVTTFKQVLRARWLNTTVDPDGTIVVFPTAGTTTDKILTIDASHKSPGFNHVRGLALIDSIPQAGKITLASVSPSGTVAVVVRGINDQNQAVAEFLSTAAQETTNSFSRLDAVEVGALATTVTVGLTGTMLTAPLTDTVEDVVNIAGQHAELTVVGFAYERTLAKLDKVTAVDCTSTLGLYASAWDVIDWVNATSALVTAEAATNATGLPAVTPTPVFLTGGTTVASTLQDYLDALTLLKTVDDVNHIVPLTDDDAVHAALRDHCDHWFITKPGGRQGYVGLDASSKDAIKAATVVLNDENILAWDQNVPRYDSNGVLRTYGPVCGAVLLAGMKASSQVGEPLTWKFLKTDGDVTQTGWDPALDSEELLRSGLCFAENIKGRGVRIVRSITTYQKKADPNRTELSCWESVLACKSDLTTYLAEVTTGKRRARLRDTTVAQLANTRLNQQVDAEMIEAHTFPVVKPAASGQGKAVSVQITADQPNNFTLLTLNL